MITAAKLIPTLLLVAVMVAGLTVRPPRVPVSPRELIRLVIAVLSLYLVGGGALLAQRTGLAAIAFGAGLAFCALAVWLCRGGAPPPSEDDGPEDVPDDPRGPVDFDWSFNEDQLQDLSPLNPPPAGLLAPAADGGSGSPLTAPGEMTER
jgi:hypothetical protein